MFEYCKERDKMTRQELDAALTRLGLKVPEAERDDLANASRFIEEMAASVKKPRSVAAEPAHIVLFPKEKINDF